MKGFTYTCEKRTEPFPLDEFLQVASSFGLDLKDPVSRDSYLWTPKGDRLRASREELLDHLATGLATFELWLGPEAHTTVSFRKIGTDLHVAALDLQNLVLPDRQTVVRFVLSWFRRPAQDSRCTVMVVDSTGLTAEFSWDDFVTERRVPPAWPGIVGLSAQLAREYQSQLSGYDHEKVGDCTLFFSGLGWEAELVRISEGSRP